MDVLYKLEKTREDVEELLQRHKNLVYFMLTKTGQLRNQDAESAAWEALWDAINTFDVFSTTAFSTYAHKLIRNAIYTVVRDQKKLPTEIELDEAYTQYDATPEEVEENRNIVQEAFNTYVASKHGATRDVLLLWNASSFEASQKALAGRCKCSPSYVSRVQQGFRAYLSGKLKER